MSLNTPANSIDLARTRAAIQVGTDAGWHIGTQLAVWRDGAPIISYAEGFSHDRVALTPDSLMPWFSGTKLVTSVAVALVWERGLIDLDASVATVIPEFGVRGKDAITFRHVLTHTGGFRRPAGTDEVFIGGIDPDTLMQAIYDAPLEGGWVPGQRAGYHPVTGFNVLGEAVRRVDGRAFDDFVAEEIFERLGMADSWLAMSPERKVAYGDRIVVMHDTSGDTPKPIHRFTRDSGLSWLEASGSGVGPVHELVRVAEMLRQGGELEGERILAPETVRAMTSRQRTNMKDETFLAMMDWGLGVMINSIHYTGKPAPYGYGDHAGADAFGHGGRQSSVVFADPENGLSVAFACNGMPGEAVNQRRTQPVLSALYEDLGVLSSR